LPVPTQFNVVGSQQPLLQELPAQQGSPGSPQTSQVPRQTVPGSVQVVNPQQGSPAAPQRAQVVPVQVVLGEVHNEPVQQGSPGPPQVPHSPAWQALLFGHRVPSPMQLLLRQHPPLLQVLPVQHASPGSPQAAQTWLIVQTPLAQS
jgi:hypothetical protein